MKQNLTAKRAIIAILIGAIAIMNLLAPLFAVISARETNIHIGTNVPERYSYEYTFANGFTLLFGECPVMIDEYAHWFWFSSLLHFIVAVFCVVVLLLLFFIRRGKPFGAFGGFSCFMALATSLIYMINGINADSIADKYAGDINFYAYTLAYIPFIVIMVLITAVILIKFNLDDDYKFRFQKRRERKRLLAERKKHGK